MIYTASQKAPAFALPGGVPGMPWVDAGHLAAAFNAGIAGKMVHNVLKASQSTGIKVG